MKILKKAYSKNNNEIDLIDYSCENQSVQNKTVLIIGVVHGEEPQGKFLIENYLKKNSKTLSKASNRLLFIPCLNPDGYKQNTRQNSNGIDLNRNFPTKNWEKVNKSSEYYGGDIAASEIETKFLVECIDEYSPDIILTLHAPFKVVNYDGPAAQIAQKISEIIGYPIQSDIGYPTPGSFGTYAGVERSIPIITLELDEVVDVNQLLEPSMKIFDYLACI